jgi:hypothetical protein
VTNGSEYRKVFGKSVRNTFFKKGFLHLSFSVIYLISKKDSNLLVSRMSHIFLEIPPLLQNLSLRLFFIAFGDKFDFFFFG